MVANIGLIFLFMPNLEFRCMKWNNFLAFKDTVNLHLCLRLLMEEIYFLQVKDLSCYFLLEASEKLA